MERDETDDSHLGQVIFADIVTDTIKIKLKKRVEDVKLGDPVIIEGMKYDYYGMITNIQHQQKEFFKKYANTKNVKAPISMEDAGFRSDPYAPFVDMSCLNVIPKGSDRGSQGVTIPPLFSDARLANEEDIARAVNGLYKYEDTITSIGHFIGTKYEYPIDMTRLFKAPFGIFGKTDFGKTITCKDLVIRAQSIGCKVNGKPVQFIIFDSQGEYGRGVQKDKTLGLFSYLDNLHQLTIDKDYVNRAYTSGLYIDPSKLQVEDWCNAFWDYTENMVAVLRKINAKRLAEMKKEKNADNADLARYFNSIYDRLDEIDDDVISKMPGSTMNALWRRFSLFNEDGLRSGFLQSPPDGHQHVIDEVLNKFRSGKSVIIHFGKYSVEPTIYMFVVNYIVRKMYEIYSRTIDGSNPWLPHTVMLVEEAHRFVGTEGSKEYKESNYIDKIARETRKVGLVVGLIDQRPSKIDDEIVSQLASKINHRLDDERDVAAALSGMSKFKWAPIVNKLNQGEALFMGTVVGNVPTRIKPFWGTEKEVRDFFGIKATANALLEAAKEDVKESEVEEPKKVKKEVPASRTVGSDGEEDIIQKEIKFQKGLLGADPEDEVDKIVSEIVPKDPSPAKPRQKKVVGSGKPEGEKIEPAKKEEKMIQRKNLFSSMMTGKKDEGRDDIGTIVDEDDDDVDSLEFK